MLRCRPRVLIVVSLALMVVCAALAQPGGQQPPFNLLTSFLPYYTNKALHDELQLTAEQVTKLKAHQEEWYAKYLGTALAERQGVYAPHEKALGQILTAEQLRRLKQVALQQMYNRYGPPRVLRYPEVLDQLKLTQEQTTRMAVKTETMAQILTPPQQKIWQE